MAKGIGILLDPGTGDVMVQDGGLVIGDAIRQNQALILTSTKGEFKEHPTLGAAISELINEHDLTGWKRDITIQLESDGMKVNDIEIEMTPPLVEDDKIRTKLIIDAEYNT